MTDYPEHDKQAKVVEQTQAIGEFLEWLQSQGVHLMTWREDLTDSRPTDGDCPRSRRGQEPLACDPVHGDGEPFGMLAYWRVHCKHWQDPERDAGENAEQGHCCRCSRGRFYEVTGIKSWTSEPRSIMQLLADWAGIDLKKIEAEKRQMLASLRDMHTKAGG